MAGLTTAALGVVAFLAYQANANVPDSLARERPGVASPSPSASKEKEELALPARSGSGLRVVYALKDRRVWLVGEDDSVLRTYKVTPSSVDPPPGTYSVTSRAKQVTGSDGVPVEHVVIFTESEGTVIGFSAALDGSRPDPDAQEKTGGVRSSRPDGKALWRFATVGVEVRVVK
ncbi:hypothetical protein [Streptomyces sp. MAR4 CNX-425]|uniref:hypothetical protein n=1 Tax=Streptomyces sp. MAR4 CNX-425 TaxID=3406343 RepID=UPI003B513266